jgi:SAM-dependent methyltransferase
VRMLVAIANHGTKNQMHLARLLAAYRSMRYEVDIVVLSDVPKDLGSDVEVHVGAPTTNPWSLPFAHRRLFAERADEYDLFAYSEDDTLIEQRHVDAFVELNELLPKDEIPGFLRFEEHESGERSYSSIHSSYRWVPETVAIQSDEVFASFSNAHSACYILTREQLERSIASGGFLVEPHEGEYDMLVSAATDPYTRCGLHRRICVSRIDDVLLHHLPNAYLGKLGITEPEFRAQIDALVGIARGELSGRSLLADAWAVRPSAWEVPQYPAPSAELAALAPVGADVLSVGCTSGRLERETFGPEASIVGIPFDDVTAAVARLRGIRTTQPVLVEAFTELGDTRFDVILLHHVLQYAADPTWLLKELRGSLRAGGSVVLAVPNSRNARFRHLLRRPGVRAADGAGGAHATDLRRVARWSRDAGLRVDGMRAARNPRIASVAGDRFRGLDGWLGDPLWVVSRNYS